MDIEVFEIQLTPQPAVVRAPSKGTPRAPEIKSQLWFEIAFGFIAETFGRLATILIALLTPAALIALVLGIWRVGADLGWAGAFLFTSGFFSHWQVWIALSIALKVISATLLAWGSRNAKLSREN